MNEGVLIFAPVVFPCQEDEKDREEGQKLIGWEPYIVKIENGGKK